MNVVNEIKLNFLEGIYLLALPEINRKLYWNN